MKWRNEILVGDCRLIPLPDCSVDAVVTDPPAGIGFMGKAWDRDKGGRDQWIAWLASCMAEALRVLKPGGHALVWALPRTSHWTGMALEDAGFEVRDRLAHIFGQGFPKSLDVSKAIDKTRREDDRPVRVICREIRAAMDGKGYKSRDLVRHFGGCHPRLIDHWAARDTDSQPNLPTWSQWEVLRDLLDMGKGLDEEVWRLNGRKGHPGEAWSRRESTGIAGDRGGFAGVRFGQAGNPTRDIPATDAARQWDGWGTALKPAVEDWWLCRKPFKGTVAANVQEHGTGAINVDGCRVVCDDKAKFPEGVISDKEWIYGGGKGLYGTRPHGADRHPAGRWPPHLLLSHAPGCRRTGTKRVKANPPDKHLSPPFSSDRTWSTSKTPARKGPGHADGMETVDAWECVDGCPVKALGEQSGERQATASTGLQTSGQHAGLAGSAPALKPGTSSDRGHHDHGTAARFFPQFPALYCPKASRKERNAGCEGLPKGDPPGSGRGKAAEGRKAALGKPRANHHPTVKPVALMRWLCRLVTPPGGIVLDPFCGSGSTLVACAQEGFHGIGVDTSHEYARIAQARSQAASRAARDRMPLFAGLEDPNVPVP